MNKRPISIKRTKTDSSDIKKGTMVVYECGHIEYNPDLNYKPTFCPACRTDTKGTQITTTISGTTFMTYPCGCVVQYYKGFMDVTLCEMHKKMLAQHPDVGEAHIPEV